MNTLYVDLAYYCYLWKKSWSTMKSDCCWNERILCGQTLCMSELYFLSEFFLMPINSSRRSSIFTTFSIGQTYYRQRHQQNKHRNWISLVFIKNFQITISVILNRLGQKWSVERIISELCSIFIFRIFSILKTISSLIELWTC